MSEKSPPRSSGVGLVDEGWPVPHVPQMSRKLPKNRNFYLRLEIPAIPTFEKLKPLKPLCRNGPEAAGDELHNMG